MLDHSVSKLGDKNSEHWAINAQIVAVNVEKGDLNIYSSKNIVKMEEILTARSLPSQGEIIRSAKSSEVNGGKRSNMEVNGGKRSSMEVNGSNSRSAKSSEVNGEKRSTMEVNGVNN